MAERHARPGALPRRSLRWRAAAAAVLALAPVLVLASVAAVLVQRHQLTQAVGLVAEEQARSVSTSLTSSGRIRQDAAAASLGGESTLLQVVDSSGQVIDASASLRGQPSLVATGDLARTDAHRVTGQVADEGDAYVVVSVPTAGGRYVVAAQSLETVDAATSSTVGLLAVGGPLLVLLVGALAYFLTGRALSPVDSLRRQAGEITAADLSARLPAPRTGDEIERLAVTLNEMLAGLERSVLAQRRFVADASHELRSPVATIRTLMEVALATRPETDWPSVSDEVLTEAGRLERLVSDLLLLARPGSPRTRKQSTFDLGVLVEEEAARARGLPVHVEAPAEVRVLADRDALARAVRNLLDNAERHAHSRVGIQLQVVLGRAVVRVVDDGAGVDAADLERIFDRFVRLDESRARDEGGAGLGLAISRHLVEQNRGTVRAELVDVGAAFVIDLPLAGTAVS